MKVFLLTPLETNVQGGAVESFCHVHVQFPQNIKFFATPDVHAKIYEFSSIASPSKLQLKSPPNNNNNKQSNFNRVLAPLVLEP